MLTADYFEAGKRLTARVPIDVGSSDIDNIVVHLDSGFTRDRDCARRVSIGADGPMRQFGINLRASEPVNGTGQLKWDPDHTSFADKRHGAGQLPARRISPPPPFYVKSATLAGQDILNSEVPISQAAGPIEIVLRDDGGSIEGDVVDANGQPVSSRDPAVAGHNPRGQCGHVAAERPFQTAECRAGRLYDLRLGRCE